MSKAIAATRCDWCYHIEQSDDLQTIKYLGRCTLAPGHDGDHLHAWPHIYKRCTRSECDQDCDGDGQVHRFGHVSGCAYVSCGGCRADTGMDCMYEALSCCAVCDCYEGSLLPFCPGRKVSFEESQRYYAHYCAGTGPFAQADFDRLTTAKDACCERYYTTQSPGAQALYHAVFVLWNYREAGPL